MNISHVHVHTTRTAIPQTYGDLATEVHTRAATIQVLTLFNAPLGSSDPQSLQVRYTRHSVQETLCLLSIQPVPNVVIHALEFEKLTQKFQIHTFRGTKKLYEVEGQGRPSVREF